MTKIQAALAVFSAFASVFGVYFRWRMSQWRGDRLARESAERQANATRKAIESIYEKNRQAKKIADELDAGVSDARANQLMRRAPKSGK